MLNSTTQKKLYKNDLINYFKNSAKNSEKIGLEYEKIGVTKRTFKAVSYSQIEHFLEKLSEFEDYTRIFNTPDKEHLIGLNNHCSNISLEPGSQFEISLTPHKELSALDEQIKKHNELTRAIADDLGIIWLATGLQPVSTFDEIKIIPKKRYEIMTQYLPNVAQMPLVMMRETAGIQTAVDYKNEEDAIEKLRISLKLSPIVSAAFANSPIRNGKLSGYKSFRAQSWTQTDNERCGLVNSKLFDKNYDFKFVDYIDVLCNIQMIMLHFSEEQIAVNNFTFSEFMSNGYNGKFPSINDFEAHLSLYFTDSRLKKYLEIRNHDSQLPKLIMCVPAFWKGIMYNSDASDAVNSILQNFSYKDFDYLRNTVPKQGLDCKLGHHNLKDIAKEIFEISYNTLKLTNEETYLEPILELINDGLTPADIVIKNFEGIWNKDIKRFINYCQI